MPKWAMPADVIPGVPNLPPGIADIAGLNAPVTVAGVAPEAISALKQAGKGVLDEFLKAHPWAGDDLRQAMTFAQQKYPRLFGHLTHIGPEWQNMGQYIPNASTGDALSLPEHLGPLTNPDKFGMLQVAPSLKGSDAAQTVGHELLHAADNLTTPTDFMGRYVHSVGLPGGYDASNYEIRANQAGASFATKARTAALAGALSPKPPSVP